MTEFPPLSPETLARARKMYDAATPNAEICEILGMSQKQFLAFRKAQGWPLRDRFAVPPHRAPAWAGDEWDEPPEELKPDELIRRLEAAAGREFSRAERALAAGRPKTAEARLRIMASLVKMLADLRRLRPQGGKEAPEEEGRPIEELRAEALRRIQQVQERIAREANPDAPRPEPPAPGFPPAYDSREGAFRTD